VVCLFEVVKLGDVEGVARLLAAGASPNVVDDFGDAPLHIAARRCDRVLVELLLKHGADPNARNGSGATPYEVARCGEELDVVFRRAGAVWRPSVEAARAAARGCNFEALDSFPASLVERVVDVLLEWCGRRGFEYLREKGVFHPLFAAVVADDAEAVERLLRSGVDPNLRGPSGFTPLHLAAEFCVPEAAELLLKHGADPNVRDADCRMPLHHAAGRGCADVVELLLRHGADPNVRDRNGETPLYELVSNHLIDPIAVMFDYGANPELPGFKLRTPAFEAARLRQVDAVYLMFDYGARVTLAEAALLDDVYLAEELLRQGADPNVRDRFGRTPLHYAAARNHKAVAELLLKHGADLLAEDKEGASPLKLAAERCAAGVVELFLPRVGGVGRFVSAARCLAVLKRLGYDVPEGARRRCEPYVAWALKAEDASDVEAVLRWAAYMGCGEVASVLRRRFPAEVVRSAAFKAVGLSPPEELQPWHLGERCLLREDLVRGVDLDARNVRGETPLHVAARSGGYAVVSLLVRHGADLNARDGLGNTPLHYAVAGCRYAVASLLVKRGADADARNNEGRSPADFLNCPGMTRARLRGFLGRGRPEAASGWARLAAFWREPHRAVSGRALGAGVARRGPPAFVVGIWRVCLWAM